MRRRPLDSAPGAVHSRVHLTERKTTLTYIMTSPDLVVRAENDRDELIEEALRRVQQDKKGGKR